MAADSTTIEAVLQATGVTAFRSEIDSAADSLEGLEEKGSRLKGVGKNLEGLGGKIAGAGKNITRNVTAPILGIGGAAVIAATDFESAFAGVRKTIDTTEAGYEKMKDGILAMSSEIPASASEIAGVVESAGQLGIAEEHALDFARTMIDMGESTNMSAEDAANAFARFGNVTGMAQDDFDRLGSTVVGLGNNMATTEGEIMEMAMRLSGVGNQIGLTEADIVAVAGAMSSVGINAEAGGSAMTTVLKKMQNAVSDGGEELELFADAAGMSSQEFADAFNNDPVTALQALVQGLEESGSNGENLNGILEGLGIKGIREADSLLRLAGNSEVLSDAVKLASDSWEENTALSKEAEERYKTFASQMKIFRNSITEIAISIGTILMPMINDLLDIVKPWIAKFNDLDEDTKKLIVKIGLFAAAIGPVVLAAGTFIGAIGKIAGAVALLSSPVALIVGALAIAAGAIGYFALTNEGFRDKIVGTWKSLTGIAKGVGENVKGVFENIKMRPDGLLGWIGDYKDGILGLFDNDGVKGHDILASIGFTKDGVAHIDEMFAPLARAYHSVKNWGRDIKDAFVEMKDNIMQPIADFKTAIKGIWKGDEDNNGPAELLDSIGLGQGFIDAIYGVIEPIKGVYDDITGAYTEFIAIWKEKGAEMSAAFSEYFATFEPIIAKAKEWFGNLGDAFRAVGDRFVLILEGIKNGFIAFGEFMQPFFDGIATVFRTIGDVFMSVAGAIGGAFKTMGKAIADVFNGAVELAGTAVGNIAEWFESLLERLKPIFETISKLFEPVIGGFNLAVDIVASVVYKIGDLFAGLGRGIADIIGGIIGWFSKMWNAFIESGTFLGNTAKLITDIFGSLGRGVGETFGVIFETIGSWGSKFFEGGKNLMKNIIDGIMSGADKLADSVKGVLKRLRDLLPFSPPKDKSSPLVGLEKNGIMSNIADGINGDSSLVDSAMRDALSAPDTDALNIERDLNISSRDLNSRFEHSIDNTTSNEPMALNLNLGGQVYKAFVQNITDQQDRQVDLELAY